MGTEHCHAPGERPAGIRTRMGRKGVKSCGVGEVEPLSVEHVSWSFLGGQEGARH